LEGRVVVEIEEMILPADGLVRKTGGIEN